MEEIRTKEKRREGKGWNEKRREEKRREGKRREDQEISMAVRVTK